MVQLLLGLGGGAGWDAECEKEGYGAHGWLRRDETTILWMRWNAE
jgi:hypothetical protein